MYKSYSLSTNKINANTTILLPAHYLEELVSLQQGIKLEFAYINALYIYFSSLVELTFTVLFELLPGKSHGWRVTKSRAWLSDFTFPFHFHALEKEMAIHSSFLAWRIPGTKEPGGLPSMGSHRVGHNWSDLAVAVERNKSNNKRLIFSTCLGREWCLSHIENKEIPMEAECFLSEIVWILDIAR